jgi:hypothetical protein
LVDRVPRFGRFNSLLGRLLKTKGLASAIRRPSARVEQRCVEAPVVRLVSLVDDLALDVRIKDLTLADS